MTTDSVKYQDVSAAYSGYATAEDKVYMESIITPSDAEKFIDHYEAGIPIRKKISESLVPIGAFRGAYGEADQLFFIHEFDNLVEMDRLRDVLLSDSQYIKHARLNPSPSNREVVRLMKPLSYMKDKITSRPKTFQRPIYMHLLIKLHKSGAGPWIDRYANNVPNRRKIGEQLVPVGAWRMLYSGFAVTHLYRYESMAEMERLRKILFTPGGWHLQHIKEKVTPTGTENWEVGGENNLLKPLPFSRI
jgi:hypothetical protein